MTGIVSSFRLGIICGGPSRERGISLNSARSVMDHLKSTNIEIVPFYVDLECNFFEISPAQLYSNTPSDFDFKIHTSTNELKGEHLISELKALDLVFPVIHGPYGEDGQLQKLLELHDIPFVGSGSEACQKMLNKYTINKTLNTHGYDTLPIALLPENEEERNLIISDFFSEHKLTRAVVKPASGGSSIGVYSVNNVSEAQEKSKQVFQLPCVREAVIEPFCKGKEFTIIVLENQDNEPVALVPSEIQISYENNGIFDYRRKYLPTAHTKWPCPPSFSNQIIHKIQVQAENIFKLFGMRDFVRLDGWITDDGEILFPDFNPISGLEQNSFIFQQASRLGFSHQDLLLYLLRQSCRRNDIIKPIYVESKPNKLKKVRVLFGGNTAERQVSLMSGSNVWLKLRNSRQFFPEPYFLDPKGEVWKLPYSYVLNHTVEEVYENCLETKLISERLSYFAPQIHKRLKLGQEDTSIALENNPEAMSLSNFLDDSRKVEAFIFLALHGGMGEDGTMQRILVDAGLPFNGSGPEASRLGMDKSLTGDAINRMGRNKLKSLQKISFDVRRVSAMSQQETKRFWDNACSELRSDRLIAKPQDDGCSAGVLCLHNAEEFTTYCSLIASGTSCIPAKTFSGQNNLIELSELAKTNYMLEPFIQTDTIKIVGRDLQYTSNVELSEKIDSYDSNKLAPLGWLELTIGVLECLGEYEALNPSITVAESRVLSLEEKFQGGTGVNITPPPQDLISADQLGIIKQSMADAAKALNIGNYARFDIFFNRITNEIVVIEVNTLPALTPSTVLYHQGLAQNPALTPLELLEKVILNAWNSIR